MNEAGQGMAMVEEVIGIIVACAMLGTGFAFFGSLCYAFLLGCKALLRSRQVRGEAAQVLRLLALCMCEPLINSLVVSFFFLVWLVLTGGRDFLGLLLITSPKAVLLLPMLGIFFRSHHYRTISFNLLCLGLLQWVAVVLTLQDEGWLPVTFLAGIVVLISTIMLARKQLNGPLSLAALAAGSAPPAPAPAKSATIPPTISPGYGGRNSPAVPVLQAARPAGGPVVLPVSSSAAPAKPPVAPWPAAPPVVDRHTSVLCPVCHTATERSASECYSCGLVFSSRIPAALQNLPDYHLLRPLGNGGMSSVYLASKRHGDRLCVLKTLASVESQVDPQWRIEAARCLRQEYELLRQLDHPHIARVLYWVSGKQCDFLVLEYVPGLTLEQRLTRPNGHGEMLAGAPLPLREVLAHGITIAEVLDYLARLPQPVLHLDIKPANLIVRPDDHRLVLVDFGGAVLLPDHSHHTIRLNCYGTPGYAAPEQYHSQSSPGSDIYGLAATLYHLLTDDDPTEHPLKFPALGSLPPDLARLLQAALSHDPRTRPTARQLSAALRRLAAGYR